MAKLSPNKQAALAEAGLRVWRAPADGLCLFHSLDPKGNAADLRARVIDTLISQADAQGEFKDLWLEEADSLTADPDLYGGHVAILAFSLMREVAVSIHYRDRLEVFEASHPSMQTSTTRLHVIYNGRDHYDALIPTTNRPSTNRATQPRTKAPVKKRPHSQSLKDKAPRKAPKLEVPRRCRTKMPPPPALRSDVLEEVSKARLRTKTNHPHRELEKSVRQIANQLRRHPTVPQGRQTSMPQKGELWPQMFCAFQECHWEESDGTETDLIQHLIDVHKDKIKPYTHQLPIPVAQEAAILSLYNEAIATICREQAPIAGASIDRRCLRGFSQATANHNVEALTCFCCACIHTYTAEDSMKPSATINWHYPLSFDRNGDMTFLDIPVPAIRELLGAHIFLEKYGNIEGYADLRGNVELDDWCVMFQHGDTNVRTKQKPTKHTHIKKLRNCDDQLTVMTRSHQTALPPPPQYCQDLEIAGRTSLLSRRPLL